MPTDPPQPLTILTATDRTRGHRTTDFGDAPTGEPVTLDLACDHPGSCGCGRAFIGLATGKVTTTATAVVTRTILTREEFARLLVAHNLRLGFPLPSAIQDAHADSAALAHAADLFPPGTVVERNDDAVQARPGTLADSAPTPRNGWPTSAGLPSPAAPTPSIWLTPPTWTPPAVRRSRSWPNPPPVPLGGLLPALPAAGLGPPRFCREVAEYIVAQINTAHQHTPDTAPLAYWQGRHHRADPPRSTWRPRLRAAGRRS